MVKVSYDPLFEKSMKKIKDLTSKSKLKKQIPKIIKNPRTGKPMRYGRKGTRETYIPPFRLSYSYDKKELIFLELYHKDKQ